MIAQQFLDVGEEIIPSNVFLIGLFQQSKEPFVHIVRRHFHFPKVMEDAQIPRKNRGHIGILQRLPSFLLHHQAMLTRRDSQFLEQLLCLEGNAWLSGECSGSSSSCCPQTSISGNGISIEFMVFVILGTTAPYFAIFHVNFIPGLIV